jgi:sec-independent protein translocase protein TatA
MGEFSPWHWLLVIVLAFLLFGTSRLGDVGKGLAEGIRNFKAALKSPDEGKKDTPKEEDQKKS